MTSTHVWIAFGLALALAGCSAADRTLADRTSADRGPAALSYPYLRAQDRPPADYRAIAERAKNVYVRVRILTKGDPVRGEPSGEIHTGSGIVVDARGYIVTAAHIARGTQFVAEITTMDGQTRMARVLRVLPKQELALLQVDGLQNLTPAVFADSNKLRTGDFAFGIGSPGSQRGITTVGDVRLVAPTEEVEHGTEWASQGYVELNMKVEIGHSGGPLFDKDARVIGLIFGYELGDGSNPDLRIAYAVPSNNIVAFLKDALPQ